MNFYRQSSFWFRVGLIIFGAIAIGEFLRADDLGAAHRRNNSGGTPIALIGSGLVAQSSNGNSVTSGTYNTTGATAIWLWVSYDDFGGQPTISDSKSNNWLLASSPLPLRSGSAVGKGRFYYCENPTTDSAQTFTATGSFNYPTIVIAAFSGVHASSSFDTGNGTGTVAITSLQPGSITPAGNNELIVTGLFCDSGTSITVPSGYTMVASASNNGNAVGGAMAFQVQTTLTATNPNWTWTGSSTASADVSAVKP